jgi:5'-nucleotidase/UDP-sugar diphosphatase
MKKTLTILHTNDMHSAFIGMGPAADYTPFTLNDDKTRGGYARLATVIATRKKVRSSEGAVLTLDAGDYSIGTAFAAASREIGGELQQMARMGYDATTFGNHEFDLGPDGLRKAICVAVKAGRIPAVVSSNTDFSAKDATLASLQQLSKTGEIRRYLVIEHCGIRFGMLGVLGKEAQIYTSGGAVKFLDPVETAREAVKILRETEKVDVVIALSHGGVEKGEDGKFSAGEDVHLSEALPGIDIVIGGHSHTMLYEPIMVNGHTPVVQTGLEGKNLGELVITVDGDKLTVESCQLHPIDDSIAGDHSIADEIDQLKKSVTAAVFASRGYSIDQPLAMTPRDLLNTYTNIEAGTIIANLVTDALRKATKADIGLPSTA